jgi:hypothetical protein
MRIINPVATKTRILKNRAKGSNAREFINRLVISFSGMN